MMLNPYISFPSSSWSPSDITNVKNWWRIHNISAADGDSITTISDAINSEDMTASIAGTWTASNNSIYFSQTSNTSYYSPSMTTTTFPYTISLVVKFLAPLSPSTTHSVFSNAPAYGPGDLSFRGRGGGQYAARLYNNDVLSSSNIVLSETVFNLLTVVVDGVDSSSIYVNNTLVDGSATATNTITTLLLGSDTQGSTLTNPEMELGDVILIDDDITANGTDLDDLVNYYTPLYSL